MKNTPIAELEPSPRVDATPWSCSTPTCARRGAAERTRDAYATDCASSPAGRPPQGLEPGDGRPARTCAATPRSSRSRATRAATVARKLAALRALFRVLREHGVRRPEPRRPGALAQARAEAAARRSSADEIAALLDRIPASTPLELRDRAMFELAYACGLRAEELVNLDVDSVDFDAEQVRVEGKGSKTRFVPAGEAALASLRRYLERGTSGARPDGPAADEPGAVPVEVRPAAVDLRRPPPAARVDPPLGGRRARASRMRCATRSPRICSTAARTCERSRSCWATAPSPRRRSTLG